MQDIKGDVVSRAGQGDLKALEMIFKAYGDLVFNVSLRIVNNREDAEEVSQDVLWIIARKIRSFEGRSSLKTWIYRITINAALRYARRNTGKGRFVEYDDTINGGSGGNDVERAADKEQAEAVVQGLLGELSEEQRACIVLRSMEGLSYEGIADVLGIRVNAVRSRLKRAREKLLSRRKEVMRDEM
ncbi:MAG: sigma-70 family RNA polymerase sigma factor [Elusimicrobia bacterium]|nr:sigma-70 family RNA polymerase sigma factor [Elusimicrobiota bacterium]